MTGRSWEGGSTRAWRKLREVVVQLYGWTCHLCHQPIDRTLKHPDPRSLHVHHLDGKASGDDPRTAAGQRTPSATYALAIRTNTTHNPNPEPGGEPHG
jgi:hypothetical protein